MLRGILDGSRWIGGGEGVSAVKAVDGLMSGMDYSLLYIIACYGILAAILAIGLLVGVFVYFMGMSVGQKNHLGNIIGFGCTAVLIVQIMFYVLVNTGVIPSGTVYCPFLTSGGTGVLATAMDLRDVNLVLDLDEAATFVGDAPWSAEALENIVKNCMEHTPAGGTVTVTVREDALATTLAVNDTGPGIAAEDLPHIFERFYRGRDEGTRGAEDSRSANGLQGGEGADAEDVRQPAGFGIGLSLAQALVSAQGGTLRAANNPEGGARFEIAFPKLVV